ncbi:asparagine synthase [Sulfuricaulis limicola]|uniref:asparagine synthase (glutamine-hydrolyzing) n=1 Tax=Sulfuricaulis limicola TaxID=1620215 RepID=A0A1B4XGT3_9GAMM|nr:asparagine synthase (glutamine-hydrolyzing) [Sulfuricaulis limicola]BAV34014.1 asparagine synthase [Sulfuricaulis limicola]
MCGIAGIVAPKGFSVDKALLERMTRSMAHRGPDDQGVFVHENVGLGHRRLSIIDLSSGHQPLFNEDGTVVVVYNGEIYNFRELKAELEARGHVFRTHCDTEVIVHAYEQWGADCPNKFRGMFAFAIFDRNTGDVFLCRDRVGVKPLYFAVEDGRLLFASEIKAILPALARRPGINLSRLDFYVSLGYVPGDETLFAGIRKLLPGHTLTWKNGGMRIARYWDLANIKPLKISFDEARQRFEEMLLDCVRMRLMSDVPLGAFLSGGLDSSAIVACMSRISPDPVKTFTVGYSDDPDSSEFEYARIVAKHFKTEHHEFNLGAGDFFESLDLLLMHAEEPVVESAAVALYRISKLAREHAIVLLSGEGGDEILAGYPLHRLTRSVNRAHGILRMVPRSLLNRLGPVLAAGNEKRMKYWDWACQPLRERYQSISNDVTGSIKREMYHDALAPHLGTALRDYYVDLFDRLPAGHSDMARMAYADINSWLPEDLLLKADKMTMATSVELRVPLLDYQLMEFCVALPDDFRLNGHQGKYLMKKVMEKYLPHEIIYRKKRGFPVPIAKWFRTDLREKAREILLDPKSVGRHYFRKTYIENVLDKHATGSEDLSRRIFSLLTLELWHQKYIDT